jgi:hypothetical protein
MVQLVLMLGIGLLLLASGLFVLVRGFRRSPANSGASDFELSNLLRLVSLEIKNPALLFSDADYRLIQSEPRLRPLARELWKDRRRIALTWLRQCQRDVGLLWRFRRFLVSRGASETLRGELAAVFQLFGLTSLLTVLRVSVWLWGPYAFTSLSFGVWGYVQMLKRSCARMLEGLPREEWHRVAAEWGGAEAAH